MMSSNGDIEAYLDSLRQSTRFGPQVVTSKTFPERKPRFAKKHPSPDNSIQNGLNQLGIDRLYCHQQEAIDEIRKGKDVVVATPTASGKSLIYNLPVIEESFRDDLSRFLYLFPLKALGQDQLRILTQLHKEITGDCSDTVPFCAIYDGDTPVSLRTKIRKQRIPVIITNPDMVHLSLLPHHDAWSHFFKNLKHIIIDEVHTYRGVFGTHISWVLKRLLRIATYYGSKPTCIALSATIGNPQELVERLIGREVTLIDQTGAPTTRKHFVFLNPWDSSVYAASQLLEAAVKRQLRTIVYTKSRKMTELITAWTQPKLGQLGSKLSSYRAGFLPEDRREIESRLSRGDLLGVISTSALELGIDIGDLDLCILVGYPGSIMATWQRSGRVGRGVKPSAVILIGGEDALDQHFMKFPEDFFTRPPENGALNPFNRTIMEQHLHCAAAENPLSPTEPLYQESQEIQAAIDHMAASSVLHEERSGAFWLASRKRPQLHVDLRGSGNQLAIIFEESGEIIGEIDSGRALKETHPGAVYLHLTKVYLTKKLDLETREVVVTRFKKQYHTRPSVLKHTEILETIGSKILGPIRVSHGRLRVTEKVTGYRTINNYTQKTIAKHSLDLPEQIIDTEGMWVDLDERLRHILIEEERHFMGAIHAIEHTMIAMFPLLILCDRNDIGGISCPVHEQTGTASIFIYDGYSGGAGLCFSAYELIVELLSQVEKTIRRCGCETGCPSCVHSPKCGSGNRPIDKAAALYLITQMLDESRPQFTASDSNRFDERGHRSSILPQKNAITNKQPRPRGLDVLPPRYGVFDLETKRSAQEVGGWNRSERMGMSVGVIYDAALDGFTTYLEEEVESMIDHLFDLDLVVGFNNKRFDYRVLSAYTDRDLYRLPSLDILEAVHRQLSYRLSLDRLVEHTLGATKTADGLQALRWFKQGKISEIVSYCKDDVRLTRNLLLHELENGYVLFSNKAGDIVRLPLGLDQLISSLINR